METARVSAIIPIRNRAGIRLENCLRSLRWQRLPAAELEIVVSDFGSDPEASRTIAECAARHDARLVRIETGAMWNRARALNFGIQAASGGLIFCTDADMIFAPDFVPTILAEQQQHDERLICICRCHDLPEAVPESLHDVGDFAGLAALGALRLGPGTGACQAARREFFLHARGYDEKYRYWGKEDLDLLHRAEQYGLTPHWISDRTSMLHQWHPTMRYDRKLIWHLNKLRYNWTKHIVVKNRRQWGGWR
ncbi:MAG: glycosyltransferase family 2 protein [Polyangiaceae bacterium]|nr:glycosyltransferase family 2 protein [Polyangiaceae bacterium]